ncbi:MAG: cell division protein FtsA [Pseudomonadota bacterium]
MKRKNKKISGSIAVIDIGSTKTVCFIASLEADGSIKVNGIGHQLSKGIRSGQIVDFVEAETSVIAAVHAAEQMAEDTIENVLVNIGGAGVTSHNIKVEMTISGEAVTGRDIDDIIREGYTSFENSDNEVIHCFCVNYSLDDVKNIQDPRGMVGDKLAANLHIVTAPSTTVRNISNCLAHCHLNAVEFVVSSYASGLACLEPDEIQLGVTLIDMGGGVTTISVFSGGKNIYTDLVPIGGVHVTSDLAKGLSTTVTNAERLKTLHGSAVPSSSDEQSMIDVPQIGEEDNEDGSNLMPRSIMVGIIRPRLEEIFEMVRSKLEVAGLGEVAGRRVVLTGGASQLLGTRELATRVLGKQVRLVKPRLIKGIAEAVSGPAFSSAIGMLEYARRNALENIYHNANSGKKSGFSLKSIIEWIKNNY